MCLHSIWRQAVIGIDEQDIFAISDTESDIPCLSHASIPLTHAPRKGIVRYNTCCIIQRPVVDDNEFDARICLSQGALNCVAQKMRQVVARNDDRNERCCGLTHTMLPRRKRAACNLGAPRPVILLVRVSTG